MPNKNQRTKGKKLISDGCVIIDTSGRTRQIKEKSVLGVASKNFNFSVLLLASNKKKIFEKLKKKHSENRIPIIVHSVKLYYALKDYMDTCPSFYICSEGFNKGLLKHYLRKFLGEKYHDKKINILTSLKPLFGKKNIADRLANKVRKGEQRSTIKLKEKHFEKLGLL